MLEEGNLAVLRSWVLRTRTGRAMAVAGLLVLGLAIGAGVVVAQQTSLTTYTGCLTMSGGTISLVAPGSSPLKPCGPGSVQIRLSGGDITSVNPGTGLTGGGTEGDVSLSVAPSYQLPQTCASGAITTWNGTTWGCGTDTNTTYSAGTGLDLNGTTFSVEPTYRLPQGCASNEIAKVSSGFWTCAADQIGTSTLPGVFYTSYPDNTDFGFLPGNAQEHPIISLAVPAGNYLVQAPVEINAD